MIEATQDVKHHVIDKLTDLMQLDIDAVEAYDQALKNIKSADIHAQISQFRADHVQHIEALSALIKQYGGIPPERTKDFKGFLIKGMTAIQSVMGEKAALQAMKMNEKLTNSMYERALEDTYPADVLELLRKNFRDEKQHLAYINSCLDRYR